MIEDMGIEEGPGLDKLGTAARMISDLGSIVLTCTRDKPDDVAALFVVSGYRSFGSQSMKVCGGKFILSVNLLSTFLTVIRYHAPLARCSIGSLACCKFRRPPSSWQK